MPKYIILLLFSTLITWVGGAVLEKLERVCYRRLVLIINIIINIAVLMIFKYYNFFASVLELIVPEVNFDKVSLLLPVGISFYTFQSLGYSIDIYRGEKHEKNFIDYALFVSFFPQLVAGPIERRKKLLPQIKKKKGFEVENVTIGLRIIIVGMFKKIVIADMFAMFVDTVYKQHEIYAGMTIITALFFFSIQIYCDFSGYSDIARGSAKIFGIELMENFKAPYLSESMKEFWDRWHISLSTWFKDYIYIPLGGGKKGFLRKLLNIMIIFCISGLWHGAAYTFIMWGIAHGTYRIIEEIYYKKRKTVEIASRCILVRGIKVVFNFIIIMFTWNFFRADRLQQAKSIFKACFQNISIRMWMKDCGEIILGSIMPSVPNSIAIYLILVVIGLSLLVYFDFIRKYKNIRAEEQIAKWSRGKRWGFYYICIILIGFCFIMTTNAYGQAGAFLYFQF